MPHVIDPSKRFHGKPCSTCGGTERYRGGKCCLCDTIRQRDKRAARNPIADPRHRGANARQIAASPPPSLRDPTAGAAFPASRARLMGAK